MAKQVPFRMTKLSEIRPYERNPRIISQAAVDAVAKSIEAFGFRQPIVVDGRGVILAGHTRYKAAQQLGLAEVPVVWQTDITDIQARGYRIADNKTAEIAAWDRDALDVEVRELAGIDADVVDSLGMPDWELRRILDDPVDVGDIALPSTAPAKPVCPPPAIGQPLTTPETASMQDPPQQTPLPRIYDKTLTICYDADTQDLVARRLGISTAELIRRRALNVREWTAILTEENNG